MRTWFYNQDLYIDSMNISPAKITLTVLKLVQLVNVLYLTKKKYIYPELFNYFRRLLKSGKLQGEESMD